MSVQVVYKNKVKSTISGHVVIFADDKFNYEIPKTLISNNESIYIKKILKNYNSQYNKLFTINISEKKSVIIIVSKKNLMDIDIENLGANLYDFVNKSSISKIYISNNILSEKENSSFLSHFVHGFKLKSYKFDTYKGEKNKKIASIEIVGLKKIRIYYKVTLPKIKNQSKDN